MKKILSTLIHSFKLRFRCFLWARKNKSIVSRKKKIDDRENSDCIQLKYSSSGEKDNNGFIHSQWVGTKKRN